MNTEVIHFVVGVIHKLEKTNNYYSICINLFDGNGVLNYTNDCDNEP